MDDFVKLNISGCKWLLIKVAILLFLFSFHASPLFSGEEDTLKGAKKSNHVNYSTEVDYVLSVIKEYRTGLSDEDEKKLAEVIVGEANAYAVDPYMVLALIKIESTFNNWARSKKGALGLMQIRPATGAELAKDLGLKWNGEKTLFDPLVNVRLGIHYFHDLKDRFDDDMNNAVAAYNHGPYGISRRIRRGKSTSFRYVDKVKLSYDSFKEGATYD
ncbi:MAG: lytic transglycosylase domain-containing protein [Thermodesulfobacteriota bacterium]